MPSPEVRKRLYQIAVAAFGVLVIYGIIGPDEVNAWLLVIAAILGTAGPALAAANTPKKEEEE